MVDLQTRPSGPPSDRSTRSAALWATVIAVPVAVLVGVLAFVFVIHKAEPPAAQPVPAASVSGAATAPDTPVPLAAAKLPARAATVCLAVTSQLPTALRNLPARHVSAGPEQNAAYGEPPITVQCGVAQPPLCATTSGGAGCVPLDAELLNMNTVCWYADESAAGTAFTTMDREIAVRVTVPSGYQQAAQWANEFSDPVLETDPSKTTAVPTGCG